jgi:formate hydrogenlyase subunit 3/multisubunit Na+/H+ antiporter MnhD subunit
MRLLRNAFRVLLIITLHYPLVDLLLFYSFVIRAKMTLGRWPMYNYPDPKDLGFDKHHNIVSIFSNLTPWCVLIVLIYGVICMIKRKNVLQINKWNFYLFFIYIAILLWSFTTDSFFWFVD